MDILNLYRYLISFYHHNVMIFFLAGVSILIYQGGKDFNKIEKE